MSAPATDDDGLTLAALDGRLRRRKRRLERMNPLDDPEAYTARLREVVALEVRRRERAEQEAD
ncbi:MAG: hypothetical protein R3343_03040 [Nitriliruptorales bacterium]|nr:hypothetical protein [Nitriliruptorales bacterium]